MFVLFEESGAFKAGTLVSEQEATLHVELPSGRRLKIKRNAVLLTFREPEPQALLDEATKEILEFQPAGVDTGISHEEGGAKREQEIEFLKEALFKPIFPDLWAVRSRM